MSPVDELELRLSQQKGAASDPRTDDLPPGFAERLPTFTTQESAGLEYRRLEREADRLLRQLSSSDNEVVQRSRRRQIRTIINALRRLERASDR